MNSFLACQNMWINLWFLQAAISIRRLDKYLSCYECDIGTNNSPPIFGDEKINFNEIAVAIHDASCTWSSYDEKEFDLVLEHVDLYVPKGLMVAIIGEVILMRCTIFMLICFLAMFEVLYRVNLIFSCIIFFSACDNLVSLYFNIVSLCSEGPLAQD